MKVGLLLAWAIVASVNRTAIETIRMSPAWDDSRGLVVYDGDCVLCSGFVYFVVRFDRRKWFQFTAARSPLGQALYRHYGLDPNEFETNLIITDGVLYEKMEALAETMSRIGWPWRGLVFLRWLPRVLTDWVYDRMAKIVMPYSGAGMPASGRRSSRGATSSRRLFAAHPRHF